MHTHVRPHPRIVERPSAKAIINGLTGYALLLAAGLFGFAAALLLNR